MPQNLDEQKRATQQVQQEQEKRQPGSRREIPLELRRQQRHESRTSQTYAAFLKRLSERGGMTPSTAEQAAVSVLCALEQRIFGEEARDLEAQLPQKLRELMHRCERHEAGPPPDKFGRAEMLDMVAGDLGLKAEAVEPIIRAVFATLQERISEGEAEEVMNQLPHDIRDLWQRAV